MATIHIDGLPELERKLEWMKKTFGIEIQKAALSGMATPLKSAARRAVNSATASRDAKRAAKATVGSSIKKISAAAGYQLKVGYGVGKQTKAKKTKAHVRAKLGAKGGGGRGVGISSQNIHWLVFGTGEGSVLAGTVFKTDRSKRFLRSRATGMGRHTEAGHPTGSTPAYFKGVLPAYIFKASPEALKRGAVRAKIALQKEAAKRR